MIKVFVYEKFSCFKKISYNTKMDKRLKFLDALSLQNASYIRMRDYGYIMQRKSSGSNFVIPQDYI